MEIRRRTRVFGRDEGSVTAETAAVLPVMVVALAACVAVLAALGVRLRCAEAARAGARAAARGDPPAAVAATARAVAGPARVDVRQAGDRVQVIVVARVVPHLPVIGRALAGLTVTAAATAAVEPRAGGP